MNCFKVSLFLVVSVIVRSSGSVRLDNNGGYSLVVAVDPSMDEPEAPNAFISGMTNTLQTFSRQLFTATDRTFYLKQVDLLFPRHWTMGNPQSKSQSYKTADIRLSPATLSPVVYNGNPCGLPGDFMELPSGFMNTSLPQPYGHPSKALLHLWARYRYGVWEEHGMSGSTVFPYFFKRSGFDSLETTACSNTQLEGSFTDLSDKECIPADGFNNVNENCRFRPSANNRAKSSLMTYHWLDSVTQFCNEDNHNNLAPNPQNLFCGHESVWSVIQSTEDFSKVTDKLQEIPPVEINMINKRALPPLYVLLDKGTFADNDEADAIVSGVVEQIMSFLRQSALRDTVLSVGTFSSESGSVVLENHVSWVIVQDNMPAITEAIANAVLNGQPNTDFGKPLLEAIKSIGLVDAPFQSTLLVLKTGRYNSFYASSITEEELLFELRRNRVMLYAAELENTSDELPKHLFRLAESSGGRHVSMKTEAQATIDVTAMLDTLAEELQKSSPTATDKGYTILYRGKVSEGRYAVPFEDKMQLDLRIFLIVDEMMEPGISWTQNMGLVSRRIAFAETQIGVSKKRIHTISPWLDLTQNVKELFVEFSCGGLDCNTADLLMTTGYVHPGLTISVSVSAVDNVVDMSMPRADSLAPFTIFAHVEENGIPVVSLVVKARAELIGSDSDASVVLLEDNGFGSPDLFKDDGVYSGVFLPPADGAYQISVSVEFSKKGINGSPRSVSSGGVGRLLPEDQITPVIQSVELETSYASVVDYPAPVVFKNVPLFELTKPHKILDLKAELVSQGAEVRLTFTAPRILGAEGRATRYVVQGSKSIDTLIYATPDLEVVRQVPAVADADRTETIFVSNKFNLVYYQVIAVMDGGVSGLSQASNIVQVMPSNEPEPTTTQSPTTTTTPQATTTTAPPTTTTTAPPTTTQVTDRPTEPVTGGPTETTLTTTPGDETTTAPGDETTTTPGAGTPTTPGVGTTTTTGVELTTTPGVGSTTTSGSIQPTTPSDDETTPNGAVGFTHMLSTSIVLVAAVLVYIRM